MKNSKKKPQGLRGGSVLPAKKYRPMKKEHLGTITPAAC